MRSRLRLAEATLLLALAVGPAPFAQATLRGCFRNAARAIAGKVSLRRAEEIVRASEGQRNIGQAGHALDHIPHDGQSAQLLVRGRAERQARALNEGTARRGVRDQTTVYRRSDQAYEDLADVIQQLGPELLTLEPGKTFLSRGLRLKRPRTGLDATRIGAREVSEFSRLKRKDTFCLMITGHLNCWRVHKVQFDVISVGFSRTADGRLHLEHFSPYLGPLGPDGLPPPR